MIKVAPHGITTILPIKNRNGLFMLQLKNGQVVIFDVRKRKIYFQTEVAHTCQIQRCAINPNNHLKMATVGYDNSVRIWDMNEMAVTNIIEDK
jgi:WD40 repeat protein